MNNFAKSSKGHIYGIDLLRILSMWMIVCLHVIAIGIFTGKDVSAIRGGIGLFRVIVSVGVDCFALISGYCGFGSQHRIVSIIRLWGVVVFWNVFLYVFSWCLLCYQISIYELIIAGMPFTFGRYWYFTSYVILFLFMPALDSFIDKSSPKDVLLWLMTIGILLTICPIVSLNNTSMLGIVSNGSNAIWLGYLYCAGAFLRKHKIHVNRFTLLLAIGIGLAFMATCYWIGQLNHSSRIQMLSTNNNSPFVLLTAISLLLLASRIQLNHCLWIVKAVASATFGIYIIHFHPRFQAVFLDGKFHVLAGENTFISLMSIIGIGAIIFISCACLDMARNLIINKLFTRVFLDK